jgi:hypothetical protein
MVADAKICDPADLGAPVEAAESPGHLYCVARPRFLAFQRGCVDEESDRRHAVVLEEESPQTGTAGENARYRASGR